jgi:hypothetical protein
MVLIVAGRILLILEQTNSWHQKIGKNGTYYRETKVIPKFPNKYMFYSYFPSLVSFFSACCVRLSRGQEELIFGIP